MWFFIKINLTEPQRIVSEGKLIEETSRSLQQTKREMIRQEGYKALLKNNQPI